jgi:DNA excision repair protein ERCC-5
MGVTGLWTVVAPTARPTQLATLNRKRLAVDASIWIYQFLKAVRDKEGNALRNSHVVGFFRRICKLLYFGIKPVFVFDGGAPLLKRETVRGRARRREGRREDAVRTAGKLLGMQMQRAAEEEEKRRRAERDKTPEQEELPPEEELVYVDEVGMSNKERQQNRQFKKKDQYHLPALDVSIESMGAPNDPRIMSQAELEEYARQFHSGEDINLYDFSKIDFESPFFLSLPASDRYNILNAARLRSRLRMGYSKEQLDDMFPDRMAFSRFQIERVRERNELTQRLMHVNGMAEDFLDQGGRIAGEKGKEYVLVKNEGVEGGWALGVVSNKGRNEGNAIDLDEEVKDESEEDQDEEEDFEDIAIEGLNRLPRRWARNRKDVDCNPDYKDAAEEIAQKRRAIYESRKRAASIRPIQQQQQHAQAENDELFVGQDEHQNPENEADELFEDVDMDQGQDDPEELQQAIQMSLQRPDNDSALDDHNPVLDFHAETRSEGRIDGKGLEKNYNQHRNRPSTVYDNEDEGEGGFDLQAALAESRKSKHQSKRSAGLPSLSHATTGEKKFSGPLPFESLNLGQSLLGKKKSDKIEQDQAGGFEKDTDERQKQSAPLPSWFAAKNWMKDTRRTNFDENDEDDHVTYGPEDIDRRETSIQRATPEFIDVDEPLQTKPKDEVVIDSSEDEIGRVVDASFREERRDECARGLQHEGKSADGEAPSFCKESSPKPTLRRLPMNDIAETEQASPPKPSIPDFVPGGQAQVETSEVTVSDHDEQIDWSETDSEDTHRPKDVNQTSWQDSDGRTTPSKVALNPANETAEGAEDEFKDVEFPPTNRSSFPLRKETSGLNAADIAMTNQYLIADEDDVENNKTKTSQPRTEAADQEDNFSDSDEELMRQMAVEAEEHARFTSSLNHSRTPAEAVRDYEKEVKQLRNQQKKDRRDADEVTQVMVQECQALLRLFGLPYITAPMEAEAQCAELVGLGLVDGIVTDDSDIFLFGGTRVYKNMFNAAKFVECYLTTDLEKEYDLDRGKLIRFAHLLGSDYTEGIPGVGPVTALEILTDFNNLEEFRDWCQKIQMGQFEGNITSPFRKKFRKQGQKMFLPPTFPDTRVDHAYLNPEVDSDPSGFEWGVPDLDALRAYLMATIGWSQERTDEVLVPVIRDMNKRGVEGTQANITKFFGGGVGLGGREAAAPRNRGSKSGRMEKAFGRLKSVAERKKRAGPDAADARFQAEETEKANVESSRGQRRKKAKKNSMIDQSNPTFNDGSDLSNGEDNEIGADNAPRKKRRRRVAVE